MWQSDRNYSGLITTQGVHTILKCGHLNRCGKSEGTYTVKQRCSSCEKSENIQVESGSF